MDNVWERLAQLQMRQISEIAHRRSFQKYNHRASDATFSDYCRRDSTAESWPAMKNCRPNEPSVLDPKGGGEDIILDSDVWRNLPENLIDIIFPHLPLHSLLRFRAVCRRWNALMQCPTFLQSWHRGPSVRMERPWLIFRGSGRECVAYNPGLDRWSKIPLSFLPSPRVRVVASAGGLLCVRRRDDSLLVFNPFTKQYLSLTPKLGKWKYPIIGMVAERRSDSGGFSYKIIVAGSHGIPAPDLTTEVYDSSSRSWKLVGSRPLRHHFQVNAIHLDGFLYSAGFSGIMVYDVAKEVWTEMAGPPVTQHTNLIMPQICECRGRLLMVEVVSERFVMRRVSIWVNDKGGSRGDGGRDGRRRSSRWHILDSMPDDLLGEVIVMSNSRFFSYFGHDDLLCFVIARREILAYTVSTRSWRWLPSCPYVQGFAQRFGAFAYHPTLEDCYQEDRSLSIDSGFLD